MRHIFVSYCHEDSDFSHVLQEKLRQSEFVAWRDLSLNVGDDWRADIDLAIREAFAIVVVLSPASIHSAYVNYEWAFALGTGIPAIPILLRTVNADLHPRLQALKCLDFTDDNASPWDWLIQSLRDLHDALRPTTVHVPHDAPPALLKIAHALDSMDEEERRSALDSLGQVNHPLIVEILAEAARHPIQQVRIGASVHLATRRDARAVPGLLQGLRCKNEKIKPWMLGDIGPSAVPALIDALNDEDKSIQDAVPAQLGRIGGPEALAALVERLHDPNADKRWSAANGLRYAADPAMIPVLLENIHDPDWDVRRVVLRALTKSAGKTGDYEQILPVLLEALDDPDEQVVITASGTLAEIGEKRAIPHLLRVALTHSSSNVYDFLKNDLSKLGNAPAAALREAASASDAMVLARAICLLSNVAEECDVPLLVAASRHPDNNVRYQAVAALESVASRTAVPDLIERLQDDDDPVVLCAICALKKIGDPVSVPALIECLKDVEIAELAASALQEIGTKAARAAVKAWAAGK